MRIYRKKKVIIKARFNRAFNFTFYQVRCNALLIFVLLFFCRRSLQVVQNILRGHRKRILGFSFGFLVTKIIRKLFKYDDRQKATKFFKRTQVVGGAAMAFMHGAQDGQKVRGVFMLGIFLVKGQSDVNSFQIPIWLMILCSAVMALGTSVGGYRIIKAVGMDMVKLEKYQGFAADLSGAGCLLLSSVTGIPVSTTHTKTVAIMGVGAARRISNVNWGVVKEMVLTWILTFPGCGLIGFFMAKLFMWLF